MITQHPTQEGYIIITPEVEALLNAPHRIGLPDGSFVHPLHFYRVDFEVGELEKIRSWATAEVNRLANQAVIQAGILTPQLFFTANVSDIAFLLTEWRAAGKPTELDPTIYYRAIKEAQAYRETSDPTMTPVKMLQTWEAQWNWMRGGFADLNYHRRVALERIKLAESAEDIIEALAGLPWEQ